MSNRLAFIGAGNMAEAIARGVIAAGLYRADDIIAADVSDARRKLFTEQLGIRAVTDPAALLSQANVILLCVKPQQMSELLASIRDRLTGDHLIISIAAGISTSFIQSAFPKPARIVRVMPNTPMLVRAGMSGIAPGAHATPADLEIAVKIFQSGGRVAQVSEDQMNAVTAVSGSGPAYFFFLIENMIQAGVEMGLSRETAHLLATQTARGAAEMLFSTTDSPEELRRKVTSPGGTTHAAITTMQERGMPQTIIAALKAAEARGRELGK